MPRYLVCILALAIASTVYAEKPLAIVSGHYTRPGEYPATVSIRSDGAQLCGGTIIGPRHILTAGHCVAFFEMLVQKQNAVITVVTGSHNLYRGGQTHQVEKMYKHPDFKDEKIYDTWYNDVGILKLTAPIEYNSVQKEAALPTYDPPAGLLAVVTAWGKQGLSEPGTQLLQKLALKTVSREECQQKFDTPITNQMICTYRDYNIGTCAGDSGSPLMYNGQVIGIVSGGIPCATGKPDIFTNVYHYLPYIRQVLNE